MNYKSSSVWIWMFSMFIFRKKDVKCFTSHQDRVNVLRDIDGYSNKWFYPGVSFVKLWISTTVQVKTTTSVYRHSVWKYSGFQVWKMEIIDTSLNPYLLIAFKIIRI